MNKVYYVHHLEQYIIDSGPKGVASAFGKCGFF